MTHDALERRYDGPIPLSDPARPPVAAPLRAHLFDRLAGEARTAAARRRAGLPPHCALADQRLKDLVGCLGTYRRYGIAWR